MKRHTIHTVMKQHITKKKAVISLEYGCTYRDWGNPWRLTEAAKNIVKGLIMYEYGSIVVMPHPYTVLLGYDFLQQIVEVNTTKVASVKCLKTTAWIFVLQKKNMRVSL